MLRLSGTVIRENIRQTTLSAGRHHRPHQRRNHSSAWLLMIPGVLFAIFIIRVLT